MTSLNLVNGTSISRFAFGTMQWGGTADLAASHALFEQCRAAGIAHFDTAVAYTDGRSETFLGQFVQHCREDLYIATKLGYEGGAGAENLRAQMDRSRRQLQLDQVDLLYLHRFDPDTPLEEAFALLARWQSDGIIRHIGVSNYAAWQVMKAQAVCQTLGTRIDALQPMYNLVKRQAEVELMPMAADQGITIIPYSPLGGGLLTGKYAGQKTDGRLATDSRYATRYGLPAMHLAARGLSDLAKDLGHDPATLATAWVAAHPTRPVPILSARAPEQLTPSLAGMFFQMDAALYDRISALYPAPPPATDRTEEA